MLDVHVIKHNQNAEWIEQCIASIREAMARATFHVELHVIDGVTGHIGEGRANGYAMGSQPYVTCVDDDDYLLPHAFEAIALALAHEPDAIFPAEMTLQNGYMLPGHQRHHFAIYRRPILIDHRAWACCGDVAQKVAAEKGRVIDVAQPCYVHRLYHDSSARSLRRTHADELELARG